MSVSMHSTRREALLKQVDRPSPAKVSHLNTVENEQVPALLRLAIMRAGLSHKEAQDALGVEDKGQFSRMLDGKENLSIHRLLRPSARPIWLEIIFLSANGCGCEVERIVRIKEAR